MNHAQAASQTVFNPHSAKEGKLLNHFVPNQPKVIPGHKTDETPTSGGGVHKTHKKHAL